MQMRRARSNLEECSSSAYRWAETNQQHYIRLNVGLVNKKTRMKLDYTPTCAVTAASTAPAA